jgi:hypothetical protein
MKRLPVGAGAALVLAAVGCGDILFDDPSLLVVRASVQPGSLAPGDTVHIAVTAHNPTDNIFRLEYHCEAFNFKVLAPDGTRADHGDDYFCVFIGKRPPPTQVLVLFPGESKTETFTWTAVRPYNGGAFAPGKYQVVGVLNVRDGPRSAPVPVQVLPLLHLSTEVTPSPAALADTVSIRVDVSSEARRPITMSEFSSCGFGVWAKREGADLARLSDCSSPDPEVTLQPGERLEGVLYWTPSEPGDYRIFVQLVIPGYLHIRTVTPLQVK